jgi:GNAT superfamily N-acetyltransferase
LRQDAQVSVDVTIRAALLDDAEALYPLAKAFATSFDVDATAFSGAISSLISDPAVCLLVAEKGHQIVGYLLGFAHDTFFANGEVGWVEELMVAEDLRRQRVGGDLLASFERWGRERGAKLVALATRRADAFYIAMGYEASATYFRRTL